LVRRYERLVYSIPRRCGLHEEDAEDIFQTVWVKLLENLEKLRDEDRLAAWLITTTQREAWRVRRQSRRSVPFSATGPDADGELALDELPATEPLPHDAVVRLEEEQTVREALGEMGERCRTLLGSLYFTDPPLSYAEIGGRLGVPEGSIGPTRARCLQQFKKLLEKKGF
jgi:RNA polymerase sigma factor (sigma-70 family)